MSIRESYNQGEFCWVDLNAHNLTAAQEFYTQLFGWTAQPAAEGSPAYLLFELQGQAVAGAGEMSAEMQAGGMPPCWNSYINVADVTAIVQRATELGATVTVPPMKIMEFGWLAFLQDPTGAHAGLWQKNQFAGAGRANDPGCFCWNELATRDLERAAQFYTDLFGWTYEENSDSPSRYDMIKNAGRMNGGIMQMTAEWGEIPPYWGVYFSVSDIDDTVAKLKQAGGRLHAEPFEIPVGKLAVAADAQGAAFNLIQMAETPE
jgi:hypothetical protein